MTKSTEEIIDHLSELSAKYCDLVWYARSNPASDTDYWETVPPQIRDGAFKSQMKVEEQHFDDVVALRNDETNWQHGFNSGMLAGLRYVLTAFSDYTIEDENGESIQCGGIEDAEEEFPCLDT